MIERPPVPDKETGGERTGTPKERYVSLAKELFASKEAFPFPGVEPGAYEAMKSAEATFPDYATPIDELIERFKNEGMKVVLGQYPESGNVFILPAQSDTIGQDSISPRQLLIDENMDERLKILISMSKS